MVYTKWGGRKDSPEVSRLGFGTTRFRAEDLQDAEGLKRSQELVEYAVSRGINYFDVSPTYSNGYAEKILGMAFRHTHSPVYVAGKSGLMIDHTAEDILKRIDTSLSLMKLGKMEFYHVWSVMGLEQYHEVMKPGGLYDGAVRAKERGMIGHVCISLHCDVEDTLKIIEDGAFEGITISMNAMNYEKWLPVLEAAREKQMGIVTMNSLAGGVIPKYHGLFEDLDSTSDSVPVKALRFLASFSEIDVLLSGMSSKDQIDENCAAFEKGSLPAARNRTFRIRTKEKLCSGCNYCAPCTVGIPVAACMQAYNHKIMAETAAGDQDRKQVVNEMFIQARANGVNFPDINQCISCHMCEKRCTQKLPVSERLDFMFREAEKYHYTKSMMRERLDELGRELRNVRRIGIWPASVYASRVLDFWGDPQIEERCEFFNSSSAMWGKPFRNREIHSPDQLPQLEIEAVVIMHYRFQEDIRADLEKMVWGGVLSEQVRIISLYREDDIDWFERMNS